MRKLDKTTSFLSMGAGLAVASVLSIIGITALPQSGFVRPAFTLAPPAPVPKTVHVPTPPSVKAIYMSQCAAGSRAYRESLVKLIDTTELNALIIDIRDYTGRISFPTKHPLLDGMESDECGATDMKEFIELLHTKNIYVIGRITVFQNPYYTKLHPDQAVQKKGGGVWTDHKGLAFVDVGAKPYWDTVVALAKESHELGFDEINFDYIRFPSDGSMHLAVYSHSAGKPKAIALEEFFKYLHEQVKDTSMVTSADLFGMVTTNHDDLTIGQIMERAFPYFDYIAPMVYPSHYSNGFNGYQDVNKNAYGVVRYAMGIGGERAVATTTLHASFAYSPIASTSPQIYTKPSYPKTKLRPWLQDFNYPVPYSPEMVRDQIRATYDSGMNSWMFWDAANNYRSLRKVLKSETAATTAQ